MFIRKKLHEFRPTSSFFWNVHLDGMERTHDLCVERDGVFREAIEGIRAAKAAGFLVCSNTTIYKETDLNEIAELYEYLDELGVDGYMLSPAYSYSAVMTKEIFMSREEMREKFRQALDLSGQVQLDGLPYLPRIPQGRARTGCAPPGATPTYNPRGWKGPCYLITDAHYGSYKELVEKTHWEKYGRGRDPRCEDCMMHVGFEPSAGAGREAPVRRHLENAEVAILRPHGRQSAIRPRNGGRHERRPGYGWRPRARDHAASCQSRRIGFLRTEDCGCYDHSGHWSDRFSRQPRSAAAGRARRTRARAGAPASVGRAGWKCCLQWPRE